VEDFWGKTITFVRRCESTPLLIEGDTKEKFVVVSFWSKEKKKIINLHIGNKKGSRVLFNTKCGRKGKGSSFWHETMT
jgi:hypothetical protein